MAVFDKLHSPGLLEWKSIKFFNNKLEQQSNRFPNKTLSQKVQNRLINTVLKKE